MRFLNIAPIKTLLLALAVLVFQLSAMSQSVNDAVKAFQAGDVDKAITLINEVTKNPEENGKVVTWYYRCFFYKEKYNKNEKGQIDSPARKEAIVSGKKAIAIDPNDKFSNECKKLLHYLGQMYYNDAVAFFNDQNYEEAYKGYVGYKDVMETVTPDFSDPKLIFYMGYIKYMKKQYNEAATLLSEAEKMGYSDRTLYRFLAESYWELGDKKATYSSLERGIKAFPSEKDLIGLLITYYDKDGNIDQLEKQLDKAIKLDPNNAELYFHKAVIYQKLGAKYADDPKKADSYLAKEIEYYKKVISIAGNHVSANYNLGISYYNVAVNKINAIDYDGDFELIIKTQDECVDIFKKSLPFMEKAEELDPCRTQTLEGLAGIYYALGDQNKSEEYKAKKQAIEEGKKPECNK